MAHMSPEPQSELALVFAKWARKSPRVQEAAAAVRAGQPPAPGSAVPTIPALRPVAARVPAPAPEVGSTSPVASEVASSVVPPARVGEPGGFDAAVARFFVTAPERGTHLFNNKGVGYGPDKVFAQGLLSGPKGHPAGDWLTKLATMLSTSDFNTAAVSYKQSPASFTDQLPMLSTGPAFNATIGSGPAWAFAVPMPPMTRVDPAEAEAALAQALGRSAGSFRGKVKYMSVTKWVLMSSDGTLGGSFVCFHKENEETAFVSDGFDPSDVCFRATHAPEGTHQARWKKLTDYTDYAAVCAEHGKNP